MTGGGKIVLNIPRDRNGSFDPLLIAKYLRWFPEFDTKIVSMYARGMTTPTDCSWHMDETCIRMRGEWVYLYWAVDNFGKTLDFMLSKRRNKPAATRFFARALEVNGLPCKIVIDRSGANTAGINAVNRMLRSFGCPIPIKLIRIKYLNKITASSRSGFDRCWGSSPSSSRRQRSTGSKSRT